MYVFKPQPKKFQTSGKPRLQFIVEELDSFDEDPYAIAAGTYTEVEGEIEAGYSTTIWGKITSYYRDEQKAKINELRVSLKINSSPVRHQLERGLIGGGIFESEEFVEIEINVEPWCVKDIVEELRRDKKRGFRIDGYGIDNKIFRVAYFLLFTPNQGRGA